MNILDYGIDVSHWQDPGKLDWESMRGRVGFVIVRAAYGVSSDTRAALHVEKARGIGAKVGIYVFFRKVKTAEEQLREVQKRTAELGIADGDIVPAVDIEEDPATIGPVTPDMSPPAEELVRLIEGAYGQALVYASCATWIMMGRPAWMLSRPLWVPHYTVAPEPLTPGGMPATIWQHLVGPFDPAAPGGEDKEHPDLDQDRLLLPLPLIGTCPSDEERAKVEALVAENLAREGRGEDGGESEV